MKQLKRILSILLTTAMFVGMITVMTVGTSARIENPYINWSVNPGANPQAAFSMYMYVGDTVTVDMTYTPVNNTTNNNVQFELHSPLNYFVRQVGSNGVIRRTFTITDEGTYRFRIKNNSSVIVNVQGRSYWDSPTTLNFMYDKTFIDDLGSISTTTANHITYPFRERWNMSYKYTATSLASVNTIISRCTTPNGNCCNGLSNCTNGLNSPYHHRNAIKKSFSNSGSV